MSTLVIKNLVKYFGAACVIKNLNLSIEEGEFMTLLGPSGCGKSTTLRLVAGLISPDAGEILMDGDQISSAKRSVPPEKRNMSMLFQSFALWPHKTVYQNVIYGLRLRKISENIAKQRVFEMLQRTHLKGLENRSPTELSGGQQQRVALCRALIVEPRILLLDEPLSNLDANLRAQMRYEIRSIHKEFGITSLYVTHDQAEALIISDRIAVMREGIIEQIGSPEEVYEKPNSLFVAEFLGQGKINKLQGRLLFHDRVTIGNMELKIANSSFSPGIEVVVCIRPQEIQIKDLTTISSKTTDDISSENINILRGVVIDEKYIGSSREQVVQILPEIEPIHVIGSSSSRWLPGMQVALHISKSSCVALKKTDN